MTLSSYKAYVVLRGRMRSFFHTQHKLIALVTHRFTVHLIVIFLAITVVSINVAQARTVRADSFADRSLVSAIFDPEQFSVTTSESILPQQTRYIDITTALRQPNYIGEDVDIIGREFVVVENRGAFLKQTGFSEDSSSSNSDIEQYTVQGGDTISTIAQKFGVSVKTILWSNNLSDSEAKLVRPGDTLWILPVTGVAHTVQSGETVASIAKKYEADENDIIEFNDLIVAEDLESGTEIIVPDGEKPAPPPPPPAPTPTTKISSFNQVFNSSETPAPNASVSGTSLQWPTITRRISTYFGYRHSGLDIDGEFGDPIYAPESGTVVSAGWNGSYGLEVVIDHGGGIKTRNAHMQKVFVSVGQTVGRGQTTGEMGSTGNSTGSHTHYEVIVNGGVVNPFLYD